MNDTRVHSLTPWGVFVGYGVDASDQGQATLDGHSPPAPLSDPARLGRLADPDLTDVVR